MASSSNKIARVVLKDCYTVLKRDLNEEVVDHLWTENWISYEEKCEVKSNQNPMKRNEKFIDILMTK